MAEESNQEKTEQATPHKREEARKKGQVARSMELNSFAILFFGLLFLLFTGPSMVRNVAALMRDLLSNLTAVSGNADSYIALIFHLSLRCLLILAPLFVALLTVGVLINAAQVGFSASAEVLQPKLDKLNLTKGLQRLFSRRSLVELIRDLLKLAIIGVVAWFAIKVELDRILMLSDAEPGGILTVAAWAIFRVAIKVILSLLILALFDYAFQRWDFERSIRMTKQELKEEYKLYEGSPLMRSRIRQVQRELARMRMSKEIPHADVVVTNPTSLAVALKYDSETMSAPTVVAKGARLLADRIKEIAREAGVPIVENKPLARALYSSVEIGAVVPAELFKATAEVLAYVYKLRGKTVTTAGAEVAAEGRAT
jgi:flagellar biosynthesis protein FlhB